MAHPARMYRDPLKVAIGQQDHEARMQLRAERGCAACAFRGELLWGLWTCSRRREPVRGRRYCYEWWQHPEEGGDG